MNVIKNFKDDYESIYTVIRDSYSPRYDGDPVFYQFDMVKIIGVGKNGWMYGKVRCLRHTWAERSKISQNKSPLPLMYFFPLTIKVDD